MHGPLTAYRLEAKYFLSNFVKMIFVRLMMLSEYAVSSVVNRSVVHRFFSKCNCVPASSGVSRLQLRVPGTVNVIIPMLEMNL